jgi:hypothetical protein
MPVRGKKYSKTTKPRKNNGGGHSKKPVVNYLSETGVKLNLAPIKKTPSKAPVKLRAVKEDEVMSGTNRQSTRTKVAPKKIESTFKKTAPKSGYVPLKDIPSKIKEYEDMIEKKLKEIENYKTKIEELKNREYEENARMSNMNDLSKMFSGFKF